MNKIDEYIPVVVFSILMILLFSHPSSDNWDIWWHLQIGKDLIKHSLWPLPDTYSYITTNSNWVIHSWLADCFFYILFCIGGIGLLETFRVFNHFMFSWVIAFYAKNKCNYNLEVTIFVAILVNYFIWDRELRLFLFSQWGSLLLYHYLLQENPSNKLGIIVIISMILWVNIHPFNFLFVVVIICTIFYQIILTTISNIKYTTYTPNCNYSFKWYLFSVISIFASFIHPTPVRVFERFIYSSGDNYNFIIAWTSPFLIFYSHPLYYLPKIIVFLGVVLIFMYWLYLVILKHKSINIAVAIFNILCLILFTQYSRCIWLIIFPILTIFIYLKDIKYYPSIYNNNVNIQWNHLLIVYITLALTLYPFSSIPKFPNDVIKYWNENQLQGNVFSNYLWSGYITWNTDKSAKIFVDTRNEPFTRNATLFSINAANDLAIHINILKVLKTDYVILENNLNHNSIHLLEDNNLIEVIYKSEFSTLIKLNKNEIENIYGTVDLRIIDALLVKS